MEIKLKIKKYTPAGIAEICGGELICANSFDGGAFIGSVCTDSRECYPGTLFIAIKGERADGHDYIVQAAGGGASCVLCERIPPEPIRGCALVKVPDTIKALGEIARDYRRSRPHKVIAVTGSVGKTTTKEFIAAALSESFSVNKTEGNLNNEIGLPLSILKAEPHNEISVLEMGMSGEGEIEYLSSIAEPDVAVITNIGTSHMEKLGSRENICRAKLEIISGLRPGGILILNGDEPLFNKLPAGVNDNFKVIYAAQRNRTSDIRAVNNKYGVSKSVFDLLCSGRICINVEIPVMGQHNVYAALFAFGAGCSLGMSDDQIRRGLLRFKNAGMRQNIYELRGACVIEDCYNASPESMRAAIDVMCEMSRLRGGARMLALFGDMLELGPDAKLYHRQIGVYMAQRKVNQLYTYGPLAEEIAKGAIGNGIRAENVYVNIDLNNPEATGELLLGNLRAGDILLVKASRAVGAERVLEYIKPKS